MTPKKKILMGARENIWMSNFTEFKSYTWNFQNFNCVITILVKFDIHFLGIPWQIFFGVTTDDILHLKPLKNVKRMQYIFSKLFWYKVFVYWKLKLLIPGGFRLNASIYNHPSRIKVESRKNLSILKMLNSKKAPE